jgi:hypothetical protein
VAITRLSGGNTPADGADPRTFPAIWNATADDLDAGDYSNRALIPAAGEWLLNDLPGPAATMAMTLDRLYAVPLHVPKTTTFDRISIRITTASAAGGLIRLGLYASDGNKPTTLILDAGTVAADATGTPQITISQTLSQGFVFVAAVNQVQQASVNRHPSGGGGSHRIPTSDLANSVANKHTYYRETGVTGTLPSTYTVSGIGFVAFDTPYIALRAS